MASPAIEQLRAERAAQRATSGYKPIEYTPPNQNPKYFGVEITPDFEEKSFGARALQDTAMLAYGVPTGLAKLGTGIFTHPIETAKEVGGALVKVGKDIVGTTGLLGEDAQKESIDYYKAHPVMGLLDVWTVASLGTGAVLKSSLNSVTRAAMKETLRAGVKEGVEESLIRSVMETTRSVINPKRVIGRTFGVGKTRVSTPFMDALSKTIRTGETAEVVRVVRDVLVKGGVAEETALRLAQTTAKSVAESVFKQSSRLKVLDGITHPVAAAGRGLSAPVGAVSRAIFGTPEQTAVGRLFGNEVVQANKKTALGLERWLEANVMERGIENTVESRLRVLMEWKKQSDFANLTTEQLFKDFESYVQHDAKLRNLRELTGSDFVGVKALSKETAESMATTVKENIKSIIEEVGEIAKETPQRKVDLVFDKLSELLEQNYGRDFVKYSARLREAFGQKGSVSSLERAILALSSSKPSISFTKWSPEAQAIVKELEGFGYQVGMAPTGKKISFAADVVEGVKSAAFIKPLKAVKEEAYSSIKKNGGVTISLKGNKPTSGFAFAPSKGTEFSVAVEKFTLKHLSEFVKKNAKELGKKGNHIGGWISDGKVYLDISRVGEASVKTLKEAVKGEQLAVFDLETGKEIALASMKDGVYNILDEATTIYDKYRRENPTRNGVGGIGGAGEFPEGLGGSAAGRGISESAFDTQRKFLGRVLDNFGFSTRGVVEGTNEFVFRQSWIQNAMKDIGEKFGGILKIEKPVAVKTTTGTIAKTQKLTIPTEKLYEWLYAHRNEIYANRQGAGTFKAFRPVSVFDITTQDLTRFGFTPEVASAIQDVSRKSLRAIPTSVTGVGEKLINLMRTADKGFAKFGTFYDGFLKTAFYMRYQSGLSIMFQAQQYIETKLMSSLLTKNAKLLPGVEGLAGFGQRMIPSKVGGILGRTKTYLQKITKDPELNELVIARDELLPNVRRALEDTMGTPEFARIRSTLEGVTKKVETGADILSRQRVEAFWLQMFGGWSQGVAAKTGKALAEKFGMTLEEATAFTMKDGTKIYKYPQLVRTMQDVVQETLHYKVGFQTSPLAKTLNIVFFPFRFQVKTIDVTAKWLGSIPATSRAIVINNWVHFSNWAGTDEGIEWRKTHKNLLYSILAYTTAWEQMGDSIDSVSRGRLFGGQTGLIGGVPFGMIYNTAQELAIIPDDPDQVDPATGRLFRFKEVPRDLVSDESFLVAMEEFVFMMLPGLPLYTVTGGVVKGASYRNFMENIIESAWGWSRAKIEGQDPKRGRQMLERDFMRVKYGETR